MVDQERTYTVPLRKEFLKVPRYRRTQKSIKTLKNFLVNYGMYLDSYLVSQ